MTARENVEELIVQPFGRLEDLLQLNLRRDVEVVAHVACLEVQIDQGDAIVLPALPLHQLNGRLDHQRRIAHAARARDERDHNRPRKRRRGRRRPRDEGRRGLRAGVRSRPPNPAFPS